MIQALKFWRRHMSHAIWLVVSLAGATAVTTAVVAVARASLWRPLPVRQPEELVRVRAKGGADVAGPLDPQEFQAWRARQDVFTDLASYQLDFGLDAQLGDRVESLGAVHVTTSMFDLLGVVPVVGRTFVAADAPTGAPQVAMLSERAWRRLFAADPSIVGRTVRFSSSYGVQPAEIVGVVPDGLDLQTFFPSGVDVFRPVPDGVGGEGFGTYWGGPVRHVIARLAGGRDRAGAEARMSAIVRDVGADHPRRRPVTGVHLVSLHEELYGTGRPFVTLLELAAWLVGLVACANASGVMLALAGRRAKERAVRLALGASRARVMGQALAEALVVSAVSGVVSLVLSRWLLHVLVILAPAGVRRMSSATIGWPELAVGIGLTLIFGVVLAVVPAWARSSRDLAAALGAGRTSTATRPALRIRHVLVAGQVAVVFALLAAAGITLGTLWKLSHQSFGFVVDRVLLTEFWVPRWKYPGRSDSYQTLVDDIRARALAAPGAREVALAFDGPLIVRYAWASVTLPGGKGEAVVSNQVSEGFFDVLGIPFLAGRDFRRADYPTARDVVIVNESFSRRCCGGVPQAMGRRLGVGGRMAEIIGVVGDVREQDLARPMDPAIYTLLGGPTLGQSRLFLISRERGPISAATAALIEAVRRVDPELPVTVAPLSDRVRDQTATARLQGTLLGWLAVFTLLLAGLGIYALVSQLVADRSREMGIRTALGAEPRSLIVLMMRSAIVAGAAGVLAGLLLGWAVVRTLRAFLFDMSPFDPRAWFLAVVLLATAVVLASWLPARRVAMGDPASVLRQE